MEYLNHGVAIINPITGVWFGHKETSEANLALYERLLAHREICKIGESARPYFLNEHIVFCPSCRIRLGSLRGTELQRRCNIQPSAIESVGIVGFGQFGEFFARHLAIDFDVSAWDVTDRPGAANEIGVYWESLEQVVKKDLVILAVPLSSLESVLISISELVDPTTLVIDVCSVKKNPLRLMEKYLPHAHTLGTHPLFGPQSAKDGMHGHRFVICPTKPPSAKTIWLKDFLVTRRGLEVIELSAEDHDREMAMVQALSHFVARGLTGCGIRKSSLATVAFDRFCEATELLAGDSWELFKTIELGNPFAGEMRVRFLEELNQLQRRLTE